MKGQVPARSAKGMTLIEAMVALALLALLSVGIISSFRMSEHTYRQLVHAEAHDRDILNAQRFLRRILESAYPFEPAQATHEAAFGLEGSVDQLMVTAPMPQAAGASGYYRYELALTTTQAGVRNLIVRWSLDGNRGDPASSAGRDGTAPQEEVLLEDVQSVEWAYLERPEASAPFTPRWLSTWRASARLPSLVRLRAKLGNGETRVWPDLIVAPRVTDGAGCQFDVVSQACREAGS